MKNIAKFTLFFCMTVCMMVTSLPITALAVTSPSPWAAGYVNTAIFVSLVPDDLQSDYAQPITRAEFSALAVALYETVRGEITGRVSFIDTNDVNVEKAAYIGIVSGVGNNSFDPNTALSREQAAVMLVRLTDAIEQPLPARAASMANFSDNSSIAPWAIESVGKVSASGIMSGIDEYSFAPQQKYTREQAIVTIMRIFESIRDVGANILISPSSPSSLPVHSGDNTNINRNESRDRHNTSERGEVRDRHGNTIDDSAAFAERANINSNNPASMGGESMDAWIQRMIDRGYSMEKIEVMIYGPNHPRFAEFFPNVINRQ